MTASDVLADLAAAAVTLFVEGDKLRFRSLPGAYTPALRQAVADQRSELLALLKQHTGEAADAELRKALAVIDAAPSAAWLSTTQRNLLAVFRQQVEDYHRDRDPLLFGASAWLEAHVGRWRAAHEQAIRSDCWP